MLVNCLGSPGSGKTTLSAKVFAYFKEAGVVSELVTEQARIHIAGKRAYIDNKDNFKLSTLDQYLIFEKQEHVEDIFLRSCEGRALIISDSSPLNALFYMPEEELDDLGPKTLKKIRECVERVDIFFYCKPVFVDSISDSNRLHSYDESLSIDKKIPKVLYKVAPDIVSKMEVISGDLETRTTSMVNSISRNLIVK